MYFMDGLWWHVITVGEDWIFVWRWFSEVKYHRMYFSIDGKLVEPI